MWYMCMRNLCAYEKVHLCFSVTSIALDALRCLEWVKDVCVIALAFCVCRKWRTYKDNERVDVVLDGSTTETSSVSILLIV